MHTRGDQLSGGVTRGVDLTPIVEVSNHILQEFGSWVDDEVENMEGK